MQEVVNLSEVIKSFLISIDDEGYEDQVKIDEISKLISSKCMSKGFPMISGADRLIKHLHRNNIPMAIATNGIQKELDFTMSATNGFEPGLFSHFVAGADDPDVKNNKPAPDVYLICFNRFTPPPKSLDNCVIFEDSLKGITGAVASGMKTVLINERKTDSFDGIADKITVIVDSFNNFKPESVGFPPY